MAHRDLAPVTDQEKQAFLDRVAAGQSIVEAAGNESFRRKLYRLRDSDPDFAAEWKTAYQEGTDTLVAEARRRAVEGVEDVKMIGSGDMQREVPFRHYSDSLLMFLIKQRDPTYRDNHKVEITGPNNGPVQVEHRGVKLTDVLTVARSAGVHTGD
jgi:hypothetical protein